MNNDSVAVKKTKTKANRKGKKQWRKNVDLTEVEQSLEQLEKQKITFGEKLSKKGDDELFTLDVGGAQEDEAKPEKKRKSTLDIILGKRSEVPAIINPRQQNRVSKKDKKLPVIKPQVRPVAKSSGSKLIDLWDESAVEVKAPPKEYLEHLEPVIPKKPETIKKVELKKNAIHPGTSYKPSKEDHENLKKVREEQKQKYLEHKAIKHDLPKLSKDELAISAEEMKQIIVEEKEKEEEESDEEAKQVTKKQPKALTKKDIKNKMLKKGMEKRHLEKVERKKQTKDILNLDTITKTIEEEEVKKGEHKETLLAKKVAEEGKIPRKIGKKRTYVNEIEYVKTLPGSLRQVKNGCNLFKDQFITVQQNNLMEPHSGITKKRKAWKKTYTLPGHRDHD
ncbi:hypothetical protein K502DRAFT_350827 [Neoconidiobolus thromboides FSU 785]|nr:hypothetical protein K502DRAFT_350827 [Neoconidiobolus thromboides FSU 785]